MNRLRSTLITLLVVTATGAGLLLAIALPPDSSDKGELEVSGPYQHQNLSIYLLHAKHPGLSGDILTLEEALSRELVTVHETGNVNQLTIENHSDVDVFIAAGDIVKGGRQDRTLVTDMLLPGGAGPTEIDSFCVEQGRWSGRGEESADEFESADMMLSSKELKLAAREKGNQSEVWASVAKAQEDLAEPDAAPVRNADSPSSLQLTLEHPRVASRIAQYTTALESIVDDDRSVVGFAFAVNGELNSIDLYPSAQLFRKLWPKLLQASATEAASERVSATAIPNPTPADVELALAEVGAASPEARAVGAQKSLRRETDKLVQFETYAGEQLLRRNVLIKD